MPLTAACEVPHTVGLGAPLVDGRNVATARQESRRRSQGSLGPAAERKQTERQAEA